MNRCRGCGLHHQPACPTDREGRIGGTAVLAATLDRDRTIAAEILRRTLTDADPAALATRNGGEITYRVVIDGRPCHVQLLLLAVVPFDSS